MTALDSTLKSTVKEKYGQAALRVSEALDFVETELTARMAQSSSGAERAASTAGSGWTNRPGASCSQGCRSVEISQVATAKHEAGSSPPDEEGG